MAAIGQLRRRCAKGPSTKGPGIARRGQVEGHHSNASNLAPASRQIRGSLKGSLLPRHDRCSPFISFPLLGSVRTVVEYPARFILENDELPAIQFGRPIPGLGAKVDDFAEFALAHVDRVEGRLRLEGSYVR